MSNNSFPSFSINDNDWVRVRQFVQRVSSFDLQGKGTLVPYSGAVGAVDLGSNLFTTTGVVATGNLTVSSTLILASGSITDTSGSITFGNENLSTTGTLASGTHTIGSLVLAAASITDTTGTVDFSNDHIKTLGDFTSPKGTGTIWGNEAFGRNSLLSVTTGDYNTAIGSRTLEAITIGHSNTAIGRKAGLSLTEGDYNVAIGLQALQNATVANQNVAIGKDALLALTDGESNFACGHTAVNHLTTGDHNVGLGSETLLAITTHSYNVAIGSSALGAVTASECTAIGYNAGKTCSTYSVSIGPFAGYVIGTNSVSIGSRAGFTTTLNNNVFVGHEAGRLNEGSGNIFLGYQAGRAETGSNKLYIQNSASVTPLIYGDFATPTLTIHGSLIINEGGLDYNTRIEGLSDENLLFVDAGNDRLGIGTPSPAVKVDIKGQVRIGTPGANTDYDVDFYGLLDVTDNRRFHWDAALGTLWIGRDDNNVTGGYCFVVGNSNTVTANKNIVSGYLQEVTGTHNAVFGRECDAKAVNSNYGLLAGYSNVSSDQYAFAVGRNNAVSYCAGAIGRGNTASGAYSFSVGYDNSSTGIQAMSFGLENVASHSVAIMIGNGNISSGNYAYCIGNSNEAGVNAAAIGYYNTATGNFSIAIGRNNLSNAEEAITIGRDNRSTANPSFCFGLNNVASDISALAIGTLVTASANSAVVIGKSVTNAVADSVMIGIAYSLFFGTTTEIRLNDDAQDIDVVIEGDTDTDLFHVDASTDRVGISTATPATTLDVLGTSRFGDSATNYAQFVADGELALVGTARVKNVLWLETGAIKAPGLKPATYIVNGITGAWQFADAVAGNEETISGDMRVPRRMDRTATPIISIGWSADGVSPGNCEWQLEYLWLAENEDTTAAAQETLTVTSTASATVNGLIVVEFSGVDAPSATDLCISFRIKRLSASANDTITDTVELHGVCFEFTTNKLGTAT